MLSQQQIEQFERDGFVYGGPCLDEDTVETLRGELTRVAENRDTDGPRPVRCKNFGSAERPLLQIVNIWNASEAFRQLLYTPKVLEDVGTLSGAEELRIWHDQIQYKYASTGGVNMWHQDAPAWPVLSPDTEVSAWIALDDVDEDNGCMSMVPGSHKWGVNQSFLHSLKNFDDMPETFDGHGVEVRRCPVPKGHVHYHHSLTWHGSHENRCGRSRRAIALHFMKEETVFVGSGEHPMKPYIEVGDGEKLQGESFPLLWTREHGPLEPAGV